ncbi:copper chaperone PCu(A)C [Siccirubricoccus sp. KC 17139]|uniref:Copper chaperone PCu(A)C n=1 Tax=Siccirubricoccus soli TaxID=2899147 RepID=A0ABT1CYF5_9PROT|nr:copper chaperone PCu(A)C [Siccirubricoccus soli]MCO6414682.1 copper chaperone PCu(A)C [Siccirubricoccus soli]MCP2680812.1 copper chaperone PCu(A)C [Siccirubricoccus soli]
MQRRLILAAALLAVARLPGARAQQAGGITISAPWSRAAGRGGTGAGFLTIANAGSAPDRLVSASSPLARATEIHTHVREGDVMRMRAVPAIEIPAGGSVTLQPGGFHLMLIGLSRAVEAGESLPVTLVFERAGPVQVALAVQSAGARGPGMGHGH